MNIEIDFFDYKGKGVDSKTTTWPHYRTGDIIIHKTEEYSVSSIIVDEDNEVAIVRAFGSSK